jgi:hypothetical protein
MRPPRKRNPCRPASAFEYPVPLRACTGANAVSPALAMADSLKYILISTIIKSFRNSASQK